MTTNWAQWRTHFEANTRRARHEVTAPPLDDAERTALATSLARFQLGESGEGRIANDIDHAQLPGVTDDYRHALKLFVAEEGKHAATLGRMVRALGGGLLKHHWAERLFVRGRRLFGIRFKLVVLMAAEVIGLVFYAALARRLPHGSMRAALEAMCDDERAHLRFHRDFFASQRGTWAFPYLWLSWWVVGVAAGALVLVDHRKAWRVLGLDLATLAGQFVRRISDTAWALAAPSVVKNSSPQAG